MRGDRRPATARGRRPAPHLRLVAPFLLGVALAGAALPARAQVLVAPGESTETAFRREVRTQWFTWLAAQEEGDATLAATKVDEILKHASKIGIRRLTDLSLAATALARREEAAGKLDQAREALRAAVRFDPDLPEAHWARLALALRRTDLAAVGRSAYGGVRAVFVDDESARLLSIRVTMLVLLAAAGVGAVFLGLLAAENARRYHHDLSELAGRWVPAPASRVVGVGLLFAPLFFFLDWGWLLLALFAATWGYAERPQRVAAAAGLLPLLLVLPVTDRVGHELALSSSPLVRGAEALAERRYDQRLLDDLEAMKNVLPDDVDVRFLLGCLYQQLGQNDRAIQEYTASAHVAPQDVRALVNRGCIRFVDGDFGSAQEDFQEALKRKPQSITARYDLHLVFNETFRTVEGAQTLQEARALDQAAVTRFLESPTLVKVVSETFTPDEARTKVETLVKDARGRRFAGHFRVYSPLAAWKTPLLLAIPIALVAAVALDVLREKGRGYALACQKCGRTFCRSCKPPGESPLLCSQCVHVYLRKDGVSIETKLQKVEEVRRRQSFEERVRGLVNLVFPGSALFMDGRPALAAACLGTFFLSLLSAFWRGSIAVSPHPGSGSLLAATVAWLLLAAAAWVAGQLAARRGRG